MQAFSVSRQRKFVLVSISAACLVTVGCGGGGNASTPIQNPTPAPASTPPSTPASAPASTPTSTQEASLCDSSGNVFSVAGNTARMANNIYNADGNSVAMTQVHDFVVSGGTTFKGNSGLIENAQTSNITSGTGSGTTAVTKTYYSFNATDSKIFGLTNSTTVMGFAVNATISYAPTVTWPANPALNTPYTNSYTVATATPAGSANTSATETRTYSTETITTSVGTFVACKVKTDTTTDGATTTSYSWQVGSGRWKGHVLKSTNGAGVRTLEATALTVNGS